MKCHTFSVVSPEQVEDGHHLLSLGGWTSNLRGMYHMPGSNKVFSGLRLILERLITLTA